MANTLKVKRSSIQGKIPLTTDLQLGELAVNTYDGKLYLKKDVGGVESIVDVSAGLDATGVLQLLKTVDGVGSGLDADLLDGLASSSANTASTIVSRDSSGNFSAGTITAALSGNASTATTLQTARTINGVSFNGSANITIADSTKLPLSGGTMTGAITFAAGQTWPTFNQNTTGSAGSLSSNTGYLVYRSSVADASIDTATQNGIYTRNYTGASASMLVWDAGGSTGTTQLDVNFGNSGAIRLRNKTDNTTWSNWRTFVTDQNYNSYSPTLTGGGASGTWAINVTGNAATVTNGLYSTGSYDDPAWITSINYSKLTGTIPTWNQNTTGSAAKWTTARTLSFTGDATGSGSVDGSTNVATALTLANSGVASGTYTKITVDAKGRATSGTTLADTDIPALDASKITTGVFDPARLPSYVDDVLEYANLASFPTTGTTGKIYVALDTNKTYRWSGTVYVYITSGAVDSVAGKTGVVTLTNADVGLSNVENKSSATIRGEITSTNVTSALGFTPYNSTNPNGYTSNTGTVTSVSGTGTASGLTLSGTVTSTGALTLSGTVNALAAGTYGISISGNADTIDNLHASSFLRSDTSTTYSGGVLQVTVPAGSLGSNTGSINTLQIKQDTVNADAFMTFHIGSDFAGHFGIDGTTNDLFVGGWSYGSVKNKIWHAGNDGTGSSLDADLLDGQHASAFSPVAGSSSITTVGTIATGSWNATNIALGKGGTNAALTAINGGIVYSTASAMAITPAGTAGYFLKANGAAAPTWVEPTIADMPDAWVKKSVRVATTANITLSAPQTIDGIAVVAGDRILVKDQTTASQNGIYVVAAAAWTRATDANTTSKLAGALVNVDSGTTNGGLRFDTDFKATDTLDTTSVNFYKAYDFNDATVANTASKLVLRDASGNFSAGTITAALSGNATTATTLQTARTLTIGSTGKTFNGSANVAWSLAEIGAYAATNPNGYTSNTGTVTSIVAGTGLSGGTITTTGTIALANTAVTAGSYTSANITVDAQGRITAASSGNSGGITIVDDVTTATAVYPVWENQTSGSTTQMQVSSTKLSMIPSTGTITSAGNFVANSDETLKTNWRSVQDGFVSSLAKVKSGIYDRIDIELTQTGVSAQSLQELLPEAVQANENGILSVAYGNAALVAAVELAKEVVDLKAQIAELKALIMEK